MTNNACSLGEWLRFVFNRSDVLILEGNIGVVLFVRRVAFELEITVVAFASLTHGVLLP